MRRSDAIKPAAFKMCPESSRVTERLRLEFSGTAPLPVPNLLHLNSFVNAPSCTACSNELGVWLHESGWICGFC